MQDRTLSSQSIRAFTRALQSFLDGPCTTTALGHWQKHLLSEGLWEFGVYVRQIKKLEPALWKNVQESLSQGQVESKLWLYQVLRDVLPPGSYSLHVGGGWTGTTALLGLWLLPDLIRECVSFDIDPSCEHVARSLNEPYSWNGRFRAETLDLKNFQFAPHQAQILLNTVCEHQNDFQSWYAQVPQGQFLVLQNNDFFGGRDHVNCVKSLQDFERQAPLSTVLFAGELSLFDYKRFMLVGVK